MVNFIVSNVHNCLYLIPNYSTKLRRGTTFPLYLVIYVNINKRMFIENCFSIVSKTDFLLYSKYKLLWWTKHAYGVHCRFIYCLKWASYIHTHWGNKENFNEEFSIYFENCKIYINIIVHETSFAQTTYQIIILCRWTLDSRLFSVNSE